jgi:hypothetical protein
MRKDVVIATVEHVVPASIPFPKGVPKPPDTPTLYTVYIGSKQWKKVEETIADPEDVLIIEGAAAYDPEIRGIAVFATNVTTKLLQRQKRESQAAPQEGAPKREPAQAGVGSAARPPKPLNIPAALPSAPEIDFPIPPKAPPDVVERLRELHTAAHTYRQKLADLEGNPSGSHFTLDMSRKLLKNTEDQIAALEKQYS